MNTDTKINTADKPLKPTSSDASTCWVLSEPKTYSVEAYLLQKGQFTDATLTTITTEGELTFGKASKILDILFPNHQNEIQEVEICEG